MSGGSVGTGNPTRSRDVQIPVPIIMIEPRRVRKTAGQHQSRTDKSGQDRRFVNRET